LLSDAPSYWVSPKEPNKDNCDDKITALTLPALEINNQPTMVTWEDVTDDGGVIQGGQGKEGRGQRLQMVLTHLQMSHLSFANEPFLPTFF
jgi:hypothetical protein